MLDDIRNKAQSLGVKLIFGVIILVFVFWGMGNMAGSSGGSLASVNGEAVTLKEFGRELQRAGEAEHKANPDLYSNEAKYKDFKRRLLTEIVAAKLRLQEAKRLGLVVTPHELKAVIDTFPVFHDDKGVFNSERYVQMLSANNLTPGEFEEDLGKGILESKLMRYVSMSASISEAEARKHFDFVMEKRLVDYVIFNPSDYADKAKVSDAEISDYYDRNKEEFRTPVMADVQYLLLTPDTLGAAYTVSDEEVEERYKVGIDSYKRAATFQSRHIFLPCPPDGSTEPEAEQQIAEAAAKVAEVEKKLAEGADFSDLAKEYSKDLDSAETGGLLGWLEAGQTGSKEFDEAAMALEPGQVSKPVRTAFGFHIIRLEGKTEAHTVPLVEVKNSIVAQLGREKAEADFKSVEQKAEEALQMGTPLTDFGKSLEVAALDSGLLPQEELERKLALHSDARQIFADSIASVAASGKPSTIAMPLATASGIVLVRVNEAKASAIAPLEELRTPISARLEVEKSKELARKAADEALPSFAGKEAPEAYKNAVQRSKPALRVFPVLEPLGQCPDLVQALFSSSSGVWLPGVYETPVGPVIARTAEIEQVKDEEWEQLKGIFMAQYKQSRENEAMDAFVVDLFAKAEI
ncbi:SurA N-terminal domain-containing protein, partial [Desulfovibrio sp. OttesenSCG-928-F20]|nr:SurA N-terminal domain-containing protein [Desulfovibrio sp. OttesenSCG-928-F20]